MHGIIGTDRPVYFSILILVTPTASISRYIVTTQAYEKQQQGKPTNPEGCHVLQSAGGSSKVTEQTHVFGWACYGINCAQWILVVFLAVV